jgi:hypothetical protein
MAIRPTSLRPIRPVTLSVGGKVLPAAVSIDSPDADRDVRGWEKTSDHAPTWAEFRDA